MKKNNLIYFFKLDLNRRPETLNSQLFGVVLE